MTALECVESTSSSTISGKTISRVSSNFFKEKKSRPPRERDGRHTAPLQGRAHYHVCGVGQTPSIQVQTICPALVRKTPPAGTPQGKGSGRGAGASRIVCRPGPATSHGLKLLSLHRIASAACNSFHLVTRGNVSQRDGTATVPQQLLRVQRALTPKPTQAMRCGCPI